MGKLTFILFFLLHTFALQAQNAEMQKRKVFKLPKGISSKDYVPGVIVVKFRAGAASTSRTLPGTATTRAKSGSILSLKKTFPETGSLIETFSKQGTDHGLDRIYNAEISKSLDVESVINELLADPDVEYAEPNYIHHSKYIPADPRFSNQEYLSRVMAPQAWELVRNVPGVIIAIVDSGSDLDHEDLAANIYYNTAELPNGIDDDGNGKVDDFRGWDFVGTSTGNIMEDNDPNVPGSASQHGVHVSGIASAVTDNGKGISGIAFNSAKLLIIKAGPDDNGTDIYRGYEGIKYAADSRANIINCSWGSVASSNFGRDMVNYAISKGCLIIAAAGNSGTNSPEYPAAYKGVIAVANTENDDTKASTSNFGDHVTISAPGSGILSTNFGDSYGAQTGTSMSAPLVAGAAALVKSFRPSLNMQQVGELLRITSDNIDLQNPNFQGKIGRGRLNVYRALTESSPSVRIQDIFKNEVRSANPQHPDTLFLSFDITNFLSPVTDLKLDLTSTNSSLIISNPEVNASYLGTLEAKEFGPFMVIIPAKTVTSVEFQLSYTGNKNKYEDSEKFSVVISKDYLDIHTGTVSTTATGVGRIGYRTPDIEAGGLGFIYKGRPLLHEASIMIGNSAERVSNNSRFAEGESDEHFINTIGAHELINNADSVKVEASFNDSGSPTPLNIAVTHQLTAFKTSPNDKYVIAEYEIINTTNSDLKNVYVGLFADWDIGSGSGNVTEYDAVNRLGYVYEKQQKQNYAGVKLLNRNASPAYYPLSFNLSRNPLSDNNFSVAEKWETLSSGIKLPGLGVNTPSGVDVSFVAGNGPYNIPAKRSVKVAFALIGGDSLQDIQASALTAQQKYESSNVQKHEIPDLKVDILVYPNPVLTAFDGLNTLRLTFPEKGLVSLELYNMIGQRVRTLVSNQQYNSGIHYLTFDFSDSSFSDLLSGIYIYRLKFNNQYLSKKINVLR